MLMDRGEAVREALLFAWHYAAQDLGLRM